MSGTPECDELQALAPELALGIAAGDARARALEHLAACPTCRRHLEELATITDDLLLLAPSQEPPAGFESRVLEELVAPRPRRRRPLLAAAATLAAAVAAAAGTWLALADERDLASRYRDTFDEAKGRYFDVEPLTAPGGRDAGTVFGYQGEPSWVYVSVEADRSLAEGRYDVEAISGEGRRIRLRPIRVAGGRAGGGGDSIPIDLEDVTEVRLIGPGKGNVLQATLGTQPDE